MSPHARWRHSKIVIPIVPSREEEIVGGIKNALERGETLSKAKQSFLNAGYSSTEIQAAVQKIPTSNRQIAKPLNPSQPQSTTINQFSKPTEPPLTGSSKKTFIILAIIGAIILITALVLGLLWDKIF